MFEKRIGQKPGKSSPSVHGSLSQSIGRGRLSREGAFDVREIYENGVTKSCQNFRRQKRKKNAILAWFFPFVEHQDRTVVRESRESTSACVTDFPTKTAETEDIKKFGSKTFFQKWACASRFLWGILFFLAAENSPFEVGYNFKTGFWQWPSWGIYKHAPPVFWRKRRLLKKRWPNKKLFLRRRAYTVHMLYAALNITLVVVASLCYSTHALCSPEYTSWPPRE